MNKVWYILLFFLLLKLSAVDAQTTIKSGNWDDPTVWNTGVVPISGASVIVNYGHTVTRTGSLTLSTLEIRQSLNIDGNITLTGFISFAYGSSFQVTGNLNVPLNLNTDGIITIGGNCIVGGLLTTSYNSVVNLSIGGYLQTGGDITNNGQILITGNCTSLNGKISSASGCGFSVGGSLYAKTGLLNNGTMTISNSCSIDGGGVVNNYSCNLIIGSNLAVYGGLTNNGTFEVDGNFNLFSGSLSVSYTKLMVVNGNFTKNGDINLDGTLIVTGDFISSGGATNINQYNGSFYAFQVINENGTQAGCTTGCFPNENCTSCQIKGLTTWENNGRPDETYVILSSSWWENHLDSIGESAGPVTFCPMTTTKFKVDADTTDTGDMSSNTFEWAVYGGTITGYNGSSIASHNSIINGHTASYQSIHGINDSTNYTLNVELDSTIFANAYVAVRQTSANGCSDGKWSVFYINIQNVAAPTGSSTQLFCSNSNPIIASLNITGTAIKWYSNEYGGIELAGVTPLSTGNYYASQTVNGCESNTRFAVAVTITPLPVATFSYAGSPYCSNTANPTPTYSGGGVAGVFSSIIGLNFVSTATGQINLATSTAGTYIVTNTIAASGGCSLVTSTSSVTIAAVPIAPTLGIASPANGSTICAGYNSGIVTGIGGSGGSTGAVNEYQYSINGGSTYSAYTNGSAITTIGATTSVIIQARRTGGTACSNSIWTTICVWLVSTTPVSPTLSTASPLNGTTICAGYNAGTVTGTGGSGGSTGATNEYQYSINGGSTYSAYMNGSAIATTGATTSVIVQSRRTAGSYGCTNSAWTTICIWPVSSTAILPTLNTATPASGTTICAGYENPSATIIAGSGGSAGASDLYEYSINNGSSWSLYTSGSAINSVGANTNILIRVSRSAGSYGCSAIGPNTIATWPVNSAPVNPSLVSATSANASAILSWTNPPNCYDEIMIVAKAASSVSGIPSGDGTAYTASLNYGSGTLFSGGGYVIYKGSTSPQTVTNLTNGTLYYLKFFTRKGNLWSLGIETTVTPVDVSQPTDYFRSRATGNWNVISTWESSHDSVNWINATLTPTNTSNFITIQNSHIVTLTASVSIDQTKVVAGGQVSINTGQTLSILDGAGTDLVVNGILSNSGNIITTGTLSFGANSTYTHSENGGIIPTATWDVSSTCLITGITTTGLTGLSQTFGNFIWNCVGQTGNIISNTGNIVVNGNFTMIAGTFALNNTTGYSLTINGNYYQTGGVFDINRGDNVGQGIVYVAGNFTNLAGASSITTNGSNAPNGIITFNGTGIQLLNIPVSQGSEWVKFVVNSGSTVQLVSNITLVSANATSQMPYIGEFTVNGTIDFSTFTISQAGGVAGVAKFTINSAAKLITANAAGVFGSVSSANMTNIFSSGANYEFQGAATGTFITTPLANTVNNLFINRSSGVTLNQNLTVTGILSLTSGVFKIESYNLILNNNVSGSLGVANMIVPEGTGNLVRNFSSIGTYFFPVGSSNPAVYSPVSLNVNSGTSGAINLNLINNQDLSLDYNCFLKRAWVITGSNISNYDVSFIYDDSDINSGGTENELFGGKSEDNGVSWTNFNAVNSVTNIFSMSGLTNFSKFSANGKLRATTSVSSVNVCQGDSVLLTGGATGGKTPYTWSWSASPSSGISFLPDSINQNPAVLFSNSGTYTFTLTVTDSRGKIASNTTSSITVNATPVSPVLGTASPTSGTTICAGYNTGTVTGTGGSGGSTGAANEYQYSINGGTTYNTYTNGAVITTTGATTSVIVQSRRTSGSYGCTNSAWTTICTWPISAPTVNPTLNTATPASGTSICAGYSPSATITAGSGGSTGSADTYEYSINNGSSWFSYTSGSTITTTGATTNVMIRVSRSAGSYGCTATGPTTIVSWPVSSTPLSPTLSTATPSNGTTICAGYNAGTVTGTGGSGGSTGAANEYQYSINGGSTYSAYTNGSAITTTGATTSVIVQSRRTAGNYGCTNSAWTTICIWTISAPTVNPTLNTATPASGTSICAGYSPSATITAGSGGSSGAADTYEYSINNGSSWSSYTSGLAITTTGATTNVLIRVSRSAGSYGCTATVPTTIVNWPIYPTPFATISYLGTPYCSLISLPQSVNLTGTGGGIYSAFPVGLTIDTISGNITPNTSIGGNYTVTYKIAATSGCAVVSTTASVTITTLPSASINYTGSPFCKSLSTVQSVTRIGTSGGTYSAFPAGLTIDAVTGAITPNTSTAGVYIVTYTMPATGGCSAQIATTTVTITAVPTAIINYTGTPFCNTLATEQIVTISGTGAYTGGAFSSAPTGLFINASSGAIIPSTSSAGIYTITYTIPATGGCSIQTTTTNITITSLPTATISYTANPYYTVLSSAQNVTFTGTTGGIYTALPSGLSIDATTGSILPSASNVGNYIVTYTVLPSGGCALVTTTANVAILYGDRINVSGSTAADGYYGSLTNASGAFAAINATAQTGNAVTITISGSSTAETGVNSLNPGTWNTITLYPIDTSIIISGNVAGPLINFNGADNVTIDGRVDQLGPIGLTITNNSTSSSSTTSTISFLNSAENNTIQYCNIKGSETSTTSGIILFSTATTGNGNDGNTIENNNITGDLAGRSVNTIFSLGSLGFENSGNNINNNNIYNFLNYGIASNGINLTGNTTAWTISNNSFYETNPFIPMANVAYNIIQINNSSGVDFDISDNFIGGSSLFCGNSPWTKTNAFNNVFNAINFTVGNATASNVQNNTIQNISWSNSGNATWTAININSGDVNVGTITGNSIGDLTSQNSISIIEGTTAANVYGINIASSGTVNCQNNNIGSITAANVNATYATNFYGINKTIVAGTTTIANNTIGSETIINSIQASSQSTSNLQSVYGINNTGTGIININDNTIANLTNNTTNANTATAGLINGIASTTGTDSVSNNLIHDLSIANANTSATNTASVCGIALAGTTTKIVSGNIIYNLSNTYTSFTGNVIGLFFTGSTGANKVSGNFIHSLSASGVSSSNSSIYGIKIAAGATTYFNNIISLGGNIANTIYGIYETGAASNNNSLYFNTIYIGGNLTAGSTNKSYALYSAATTNTRNFRNNILVNMRSTTGGVSLHYAAWFNYAVSTNLTLDYNDYFVSGIGGVLGNYNSTNVVTLPLITGMDANSLITNSNFLNAGGINATDYEPSSSILAGTTIAGIITDYSGGTRLATPTIGAIEGAISLNVDVYKSGIYQSTYLRLKDAFDKINNGTHTGSLDIRIKANTTEIASAVLYQSGYTGAGGVSNYSSIKIYPTVTGIIVMGNLAAPLIDLNGADSVIIDGNVNASGTTKDLIITNTNIGTSSTIRFINSAENNIVRNCIIKGSETSTSNGIFVFSTATAGNGNDGNNIINNDITSDLAGRPINAIYSLGSTGYENSGNNISNNNIYNFLKNGTASNGINIAGGSTAINISGNSFYETTTFIPTASVAYNAILINNTSGVNFNISNNFIGGSTNLCAGTAWGKTNAFNNTFNAISISVGTAIVTNVQNNLIQNFNWSNSGSAAWTGINILAGNINIGTIVGNTIGAMTGAGSITIIGGATGVNVYGINISSTGVVDCQNNIIGSIIAANANSTYATNIYGINYTAATGTSTISNNLIGSTTTANSIQASSLSTSNAQSVYGISSTGSGNVNMNNNMIANITNNTTNTTTGTAGLINGIRSTSGTNIITNNIIHDLSNANRNTSTSNTASVCGIALTGSTLRTVSGNSIYNLSNINASFAGTVIGMYFSGGTTTNIASGNYIYNLLVSGVSSTTASVYGIKIASGTTIYSNNIINLGGNTKTTIYGVYETGTASNDNNLYFNTIYIGGSLVSGSTNKSYALYSAVTTNSRNFRNNIFVNARSTIGGASLHYAMYIVTTGGTLTANYNDYYVTGTGGILGYYGANKTALPIVTAQDANSSVINPQFANAGSTFAIDYKITANLVGVIGTGITLDYGGITRINPSMGAWENITINKWKGTLSNNWNTAGNWLLNTVPAVDASIMFDDAPLNHCQLDQNRSVTNITINQSTYRMVTNGYKLTVKGDLIFTNGAQIDASATNSTVEFAGGAPQSIPTASFYNNEVYNLLINNLNNVALNGTLRLMNTITANSGRLDALTNTPTVSYASTSLQTIEIDRYMSERVHNLTIDNASGVTLNTNFAVNNSLIINAGKLFTIPSTKQLTVFGSFTNNAGTSGFVLQSDASGTASLIHPSNNVAATAQRYISGSAEDWHFLSSPVAAQSISGSWTPSGTYGNGTGYDLYAWNEPNNCWIYKLNTTSAINWNTIHPGSTFAVGRGYLYSVQASNPTKEFVGNLNNANISYSLSALSPVDSVKGFNLIGNPYPSSIDWQANSGWTRSNLLNSGGGYDMWIYNKAASNYGVCNSETGSCTNGVSRYIAPMQGFFVRAATAGNLSMDNTVRVHNGAGGWLKNNAEIDPKILSVVVQSETGSGFDEVRLQFGYDNNETGAAKLFSPVVIAPSLYLPAVGELFSIRYLTDTIDNPSVPVMFKTAIDGNYTIKCNFSFDRFETVMLEDRQTHFIQNMKAKNTYSFQSSRTDDAFRFVLHFGPDDNALYSELPARIYTDGIHLLIDLSLVSKETETYVYDALGRLLLQTSLQGSTLHTLDIKAKSQILVVQLKNQQGNICRKLFFNNRYE